MKQTIHSALLLALITAGTTVLGGSASDAASAGGCSAGVGVPSLELVYKLGAGEEKVSASTRDQAVAITCGRLRALGIADGEVHLLAERRLRVVLPRLSDRKARRVAEQLEANGQLRFYDWEASLIGPERAIGGHPGRAPKASALRRAKREWRAAGRPINRGPNAQLIHAGAFPTARSAAKLASARKPHTTVIVSEQPINDLGEPIAAAAPGWYALEDNPALTGSDIVYPRQETDVFGQPNVTFGFTEEGRTAFQRLTRAIARRSAAAADGPVTLREAERLSGHFALVFDGEVRTRPIINFADNPDGIDGRTGAQIAGGFASIQEARDLVTVLKTGALPIELELLRQRTLDQNS